MSISPALLLAMGLALVSSAVLLLCVRFPLFFLPAAWLTSVVCFIVAQILDAVMGGHLLMVGTLDVGSGLVLTALADGCLALSKVWYDKSHQ